MADNQRQPQQDKETLIPEVVFEVKGEHAEREFVAFMQSSMTQSPTMLGLILANKELYKSLCANCPGFEQKVAALILDEAETCVRDKKAMAILLEREPDNIERDQDFSTRGQMFAFFLSFAGLAIAAYCAWRGSFKCAAFIVGTALASGYIASLINKAAKPEKPQDNKSTAIPPQKNKKK